MGGNKYSNAVNQSTKNYRLGCTVCLKKNTNNSLINTSSSNKPWRDRNHLKNNVTNTKNEKSNTSCIIHRPSTNGCYCNHMEYLKNESFPRLICSKHFKTPDLIDVDHDWLHKIIEFRRENWFDCHSDSFIDALCVQNNNPFYILNKHSLNINHLNDSIISNPTIINDLKTENNNYSGSTEIVGHTNVEKKTTEQKVVGRSKKIPITVNKPWIPSSVYFKL